MKRRICTHSHIHTSLQPLRKDTIRLRLQRLHTPDTAQANGA